MYHAIKKGFDKSTGEIMAWINSDDMYHPMSFYTIAEIFNSFPNVNWLTGCSTLFDMIGRTVYVNQSNYFNNLDLLTGNYKWIQQESTFWRRTLYNKINGINPSLKLAGDFDLWLRFSKFEKMYITNALIGGFRIQNQGQITSNIKPYIDEIQQIINLYPIDKKTKLDIKSIYKKKKIISFLNKIKIFNTKTIHNMLFSKVIKEAEEHKIHYSRKLQKYIINQHNSF